MGRRTIAGHRICLHRRGKPKEAATPADLDGKHFCDIFEHWANEKQSEGVIQVRDQSIIRVDRVTRYNKSIVVVDVMFGKAGEKGEVVDLESSTIRFSLSENDVPVSSTRAVLLCPPQGQMAVWFSEYSMRSSGASELLALFSKQWSKLNTGFTFNKERLIAKEIALTEGIVQEIEIRLTRRAKDRADGQEAIMGTISHSFKPSKKTPLKSKIIEIFRENPAEAYELVGIQDKIIDENESEIFVSVDINGKQRKVEIFNPDDGLYFREELNDSAHPELNDDELVKFCNEEALLFFERSGFMWLDEWSVRKD